MKTNKQHQKLVKVPESDLTSLVAYKLKDKVLFQEKLENAKQYLKQVKVSSL